MEVDLEQVDMERLKAKNDEDHWTGLLLDSGAAVLDYGVSGASGSTEFDIVWTKDLVAATNRDPHALLSALNAVFATVLFRTFEQHPLMIASPGLVDVGQRGFWFTRFDFAHDPPVTRIIEQALAGTQSGLEHAGITEPVLLQRLAARGADTPVFPAVGIQLAELGTAEWPSDSTLRLEVEGLEMPVLKARLVHNREAFGVGAHCFVQMIKDMLENLKSWSKRPVRDIPLFPSDIDVNFISHIEGPKALQAGGILPAIAGVAAKTPEAVAVQAEDGTLSYSDLASLSNRLAGHLRSNRNIKRENVVAVMLGRSCLLPVAALGVWKAGGVYLPLDPAVAPDRLETILAEAKVDILLTDAMSIPFGMPPNVEVEILDAGMESMPEMELEEEPEPSDACYIFFTSGTTGSAKGVLVEHAAFENLGAWVSQQHLGNCTKPPVCVLTASFVFDASVQLLVAPFLAGGTLVISSDNERRDPGRYLDLLDRVDADLIDITPLFLSMVADEAARRKHTPSLESILVGGDVLSSFLARKVMAIWPDVKLVNVYGATETGCDSTAELIHEPSIATIEPTGKPLPGTGISVVNGQGEVLPRGMTGHVLIEGVGIARNYLGPDTGCAGNLSTKNGRRIYNSGDLGLIDAQGRLHVMGRSDNQIKIRGYRVGLKEVESAISSYRVHDDYGDADTPQGATGDGCVTCGLSVHHAGSKIDESGVCALCREKNMFRTVADRYFSDIGAFENLLENRAPDAPFDCMLLYSGGKDSSYVLHRLVERGLRVLTYTFDNGHISPAAFENIKRQTRKLGVESIVQSLESMDDVFVESLNLDATVCTGCFRALTTLSTRLASDLGIGMIITGLSRGQIMETKLEKLIEQGVHEIDDIERHLAMMRRAYHAATDRTNDLIATDVSDVRFEDIAFVDYFRYDSSSAEEVRRFLASVDNYWNSPKDTGFCSSNCTINDIGICTHLRQRSYHNYAAPLAWDLRLGLLDKDKVLQETQAPVDPEHVNHVLRRIGFFEPPVNDVAVIAREGATGERFLCAYFTARHKIPVDHLRRHLANKLPDYMIPSYFVACDTLPISANGKIDMDALPPLEDAIESQTPFVAPETDIQKGVASAWQQVLGVDKIGLDHAFFALGGSSLELVELQHLLQEQFGQEVDLLDLFENNTVRQTSALFEAAKAPELESFDV